MSAELKAEWEREALIDIAAIMYRHVENWPNPKKLSTAFALIDKTLEVLITDNTEMLGKIEKLEAQAKFRTEALALTKGCPGKIVVEAGFYRLKCYKSKAMTPPQKATP